jgi:quercetin dioxygenase-like cupin family protein
MTRIARCAAVFVLAAIAPACGRPRSPGGSPAPAVPGAGAHVASTTVPVPGGCDVPRTGPADAVGCYFAGREPLGAAPATPLFWHLDAYPTRAAATEARRGRGTVAEAHGRVWLFTIAEAAWRPEGGERVARVGPLPLTPGRVYTAYYIEGVVPPGARTPAHRHAGPEAWYILQGTNCLETPDGVRTAGPGETLIVPEGPPMVLTGVGTAMRRTLAVIVHDAAQHWTLPVSDWTPRGACPQ